MSEFSPPDVPADVVVPGERALTSEAIEAVLADFRSWLQQTAPPAPSDGQALAVPVDLHTLLAQFVALRHEVNLQTRSARTQQEHSTEMLGQLGEALEALRASRDSAGQSRAHDVEEAVRPLLKTLVDLYDALALAGREVQRVEQSLLPALAEISTAAVETPQPAPTPASARAVDLGQIHLPLWARLLGAEGAVRRAAGQVSVVETAEANSTAHQQQQAEAQQRQARTEQTVARVRQVLTSVVTGYTMSVQRIERALRQYDLEPIPCVGEPFDPEVMEAVEVIVDPGRSSTEVIEEVRRGYIWRGRVFRYAQVRVARPGGVQS